MNKGLEEQKAEIVLAIIQLGNELSTWVNCNDHIGADFKTNIKNEYKNRLNSITNSINELGNKELKALEIIKNNSEGIVWKTECNKEDIDFVKEVLL